MDGPSDGRVVQDVRFHRDPLGYLREGRERFGDLFVVRLAIAGPMVVVAAPGQVDALAESDPARAHTGEARRRILGMVSPRSVLGADGEVHRGARRPLESVFAPAAIARHADAIAALTEVHVASWPRGRPIQLLPRLRALTDDVFVRLLLGVRDEARARGLAAATRRMIRTPGNPPLPPPGEGAGLLGELGKRIFDRRKQPAASLLAEEIDERRRVAGDRARQGASPPADPPPADVVDAVLAAHPGESTTLLVDELLPLMMAGQEPPAVALTWLVDRLGRLPEVADRFDLADPYCAAVVRETLRVTPAVHSILRRLTAPHEVLGRTLPAGVVAMVPIVLLHRDARSFKDPDTFKPGRFLGEDDPATRMLPFGGGARRCLGEALARASIERVLPIVMETVRVRPLWPRPERMIVRGTVLVPHRGALAIVSGR